MLHQLITLIGLRLDLALLPGSALDSSKPRRLKSDLALLPGWLSAATFNSVPIEGVGCGDYFMEIVIPVL